MTENWKQVKGYENYYEVSDLGRVRSIHARKINDDLTDKTKIMKQRVLSSRGYYIVNLSRLGKVKTHYVHRLVAEAFIKNDDDEKKYINHIDGNGLNNNVNNLEWVTASENVYHSVEIGLKHSHRVILEDEVTGDIYKFASMAQASKFLNRNDSYVHNRCSSGQYNFDGYIAYVAYKKFD